MAQMKVHSNNEEVLRMVRCKKAILFWRGTVSFAGLAGSQFGTSMAMKGPNAHHSVYESISVLRARHSEGRTSGWTSGGLEAKKFWHPRI